MNYQLYTNASKKKIDGCNIWMILFEIKLTFLRSETNIATFWICMDATLFGMSRS